MQVAVFDTYVRKPDGVTVHFDIIVPKDLPPEQAIAFGEKHVEAFLPEGKISARECQFCHIEEPSPEMILAIESQGYFILEFEDIPASLPESPTRRQLIMHIRANSETHRFASFHSLGEEELWLLVWAL